VLAYWLYPDAFGASLVAEELDIPLVSGARGSDVRARDRLSLMLARRALDRSAAVLSVSEDLRRIMVDDFAVAPDKVVTIPNGCDTALFHRGSRRQARERLGIADGGPLILYVGRLVAPKGLRELLSAFRILRDEGVPARLALVGEGGFEAELRAAAGKLGLVDYLIMPGAATPHEVALWMQACDVFSLPSHTEGYPNVLVEALACGRPVVATPVGGIVEIVDRDCGMLVPPGDAERLAEALKNALHREWDEAALSSRFQRSWSDVAIETLAVCQRVAPGGPVSGPASSRDPSKNQTTS